MAPTTLTELVTFWRSKQPSDNAWHPLIGHERKRSSLIPAFLSKFDGTAAVVDAAPFVVVTGGLAHLSQINHFGFTAYASPFRNPFTIMSTHRAATFWLSTIAAAQLAGINYRQYMPRWAGSFERLRNEEEVRDHVNFGIMAGAAVLLTRTYFRKGPSPSLMDIIIGGSLTDLLMREYYRAHSF